MYVECKRDNSLWLRMRSYLWFPRFRRSLSNGVGGEVIVIMGVPKNSDFGKESSHNLLNVVVQVNAGMFLKPGMYSRSALSAHQIRSIICNNNNNNS